MAALAALGLADPALVAAQPAERNAPEASAEDPARRTSTQEGDDGPDLPGAVFPIVIINRAAVLEASAPARALAQVERDVQTRVQAENDRVRAELETEERELTGLRETLDPDAFEARTRDFDRRVRAERRRAQERGALLLRFMQDARAALASALPRVLEGLRRDLGAAVILDAGAVVAADPSLDVTAAAISRYNEEMGGVRFDPPAALLSP
ncbi:MAG: OmpH family outer membrane protein [Pseudomonadota bacterium]